MDEDNIFALSACFSDLFSIFMIAMNENHFLWQFIEPIKNRQHAVLENREVPATNNIIDRFSTVFFALQFFEDILDADLVSMNVCYCKNFECHTGIYALCFFKDYSLRHPSCNSIIIFKNQLINVFEITDYIKFSLSHFSKLLTKFFSTLVKLNSHNRNRNAFVAGKPCSSQCSLLGVFFVSSLFSLIFCISFFCIFPGAPCACRQCITDD